MTRRINAEGLALIKTFEGCKLKGYNDIVGIPTIGYGHTGPDVVLPMTITQEEADRLLAKDLTRFEQGVDAALFKYATDNQFSALVCFAYNVGLGNLTKSTLLKKTNLGDPEAYREFTRWNKAGGREVAGLTRRRLAEQALFQKPDDVGTPLA